MKKFEKIIGITAIIGIVLKFLHIQGASMLMLFSFGILSLFYYVFSFALFNNIQFRDMFKGYAYKEIGRKRIAGAVVTGYSLSIIILGILFKLLHFPGANFMLMIGISCLFIILIFSIVKYIKIRSAFYIGIFIRSAIIGGVGLVLFCLSFFSNF